MKRVANRDASWYVENKKEFKGSNTFARIEGKDLYVVYSYGTHWILYMNVNGDWLENDDKKSVSTSKHQTQLRPNVDTIRLKQRELQLIKQELKWNH